MKYVLYDDIVYKIINQTIYNWKINAIFSWVIWTFVVCDILIRLSHDKSSQQNCKKTRMICCANSITFIGIAGGSDRSYISSRGEAIIAQCSKCQISLINTRASNNCKRCIIQFLNEIYVHTFCFALLNASY